MERCPTCGRAVSAEENFCSACGAGLRSPAIDQMIEDTRRALLSHPEDAAARYNLALAYKLGGADALALEELARVAEMQPGFADVHYEMALLYAKGDRTDQAVAALRRVLEIEPDHSRASRLLARLEGEA